MKRLLIIAFTFLNVLAFAQAPESKNTLGVDIRPFITAATAPTLQYTRLGKLVDLRTAVSWSANNSEFNGDETSIRDYGFRFGLGRSHHKSDIGFAYGVDAAWSRRQTKIDSENAIPEMIISDTRDEFSILPFFAFIYQPIEKLSLQLETFGSINWQSLERIEASGELRDDFDSTYSNLFSGIRFFVSFHF